MPEEHRLIRLGFPLQEALCLCHSMRREGTLREFMENEEKKHACQCGGECKNCTCDGEHNCPDCPNKEK